MFSELFKTDEITRPCFYAFGAHDEAIALIFNILCRKQGGKRSGRQIGWKIPSHTPERYAHLNNRAGLFKARLR